MLTRDYKSSAPGEYYHAYNRGNAKEPVFLDDDDYRFFLLRLDQNLSSDIAVNRHFRPLPPNSFSLISYCLMPNHFHLLLRQDRDIPTSKLIGKICTSYSMYFNKKYGRVGHVFQ
ncbi:MAG: transposase, partial [Patescibacteria group bacterium]